jgi:hypothetical protein
MSTNEISREAASRAVWGRFGPVRNNPLALRGNTKSNAAGCFPDTIGNKTDCSSVCSNNLHIMLDELNINGHLDELEDAGDWLLNKKEHPPEHYLLQTDSSPRIGDFAGVLAREPSGCLLRLCLQRPTD